MAGEARSSTFLVSTATLMLGLPADLLNFSPAVNSVGLVKNVMSDLQTGTVELTQGQYNTTVDSKKNLAKVTLKAEWYEYTMRNLVYAAGLDGTVITPQTAATTVPGAITPPSGGVTTITVASATGFAVGDYIIIAESAANNPEEDKMQFRKIQSISGAIFTLDVALKVAFAAGATVRKASITGVGSKRDDKVLAALVTGTLSDNSPVIMAFPKVRISKGFGIGFQNQQYQNMPVEFEVLDSTPQDPHYARCVEQGNASSFLLGV